MEYTSDDFAAINREINKKLLIFGAFASVVIGGSTTFFLLRWQAACYFFTFIAGGILIFFIFSHLAPPLRYKKFLKEMHAGQQRINDGRFVRIEEGEDIREGLPFLPFITVDSDGFEHRYYWDVQKPMPVIEPGADVRVTTYGQSIKKLEIL